MTSDDAVLLEVAATLNGILVHKACAGTHENDPDPRFRTTAHPICVLHFDFEGEVTEDEDMVTCKQCLLRIQARDQQIEGAKNLIREILNLIYDEEDDNY